MATIHPLFKETPNNEAPTGINNNAQPAVLALSSNANLLEIVQRAAPGGSQVITVSSLETMIAKCRSARPGVLLMDTASCPDITGTVIQLMQDLPELVVIVAGKSEDSAALMKLTAAGHIYRFLLMPLAHGQTKLTLEAAMTQHVALGAANNRREANAEVDGGSVRKSYLPAYIALGAALIVVVGGAFFALSRMGSSNEPVVTANNAAQTEGASKELILADVALAAGKLLDPPGESALDLYRSALAMNPKNSRAQAGIDAIAARIMEKAEAALSSEQLETAVVMLEQARDVSPGNPRLKFLDGQVARERERLKLTQAQDMGKKVRSLLAVAQEDMDSGRLIAPVGNNARDSILDARKLDPTDPSIAQAQRSLTNRIVDAARRAAEQNQIEQAQALLSAARQLGSVGAELSAIERSITETRVKPSTTAETPSAAAKAAAVQAAEREAAVAQAAAQKAAAEAAAQASASAAATTVAVAPVVLKRTKTVSPAFPDAAKKARLSGWVEVSFVVNQSGGVENARVTDASPKDTFDWAALQAVQQWRFEPPMRDGKPVSQATKIKLRFDNQN